MTTPFSIQGRTIGPESPTYVIAELSANHRQSRTAAEDLIAAAAEAGADAVKLQTYTAETMTFKSDAPPFQIRRGTIWEGRSLYELYSEASTPWEWHADLKEAAERLGLHLFSSPFDRSAVDYLQTINVPAFKIASFELVDIPLIRYAASMGKPLIMSTGMASLQEIQLALETALGSGAPGVALLRCNSSYPAPAAEMDLRTIPHMAQTWSVPIGLSDHTLGIAAPIAAVTLGASIVEKHLTLNRKDVGPDSAFSLEPGEFASMVSAIREVESALGTVRYGPSPSEQASLAFRRSIFVSAQIRAGERFTHTNLRVVRPSDGLAPRHLDFVIGRLATCDIEPATALTWEMIGAEG